MKSDELARVRRTLWSAADELRANSTLSPAEYRGPVLGLIFLAYAEHRFERVRPEQPPGPLHSPVISVPGHQITSVNVQDRRDGASRPSGSCSVRS